jgi:CRISPR-associated protein Cas1
VSIRSPLSDSGTGMRDLLNTLYATTPGTSLHLDGDAVRIYHPEQSGRRLLPLTRIDHIVAFGGVTITDDLVHRCAREHRSVTWLSGSGRFLARVVGPQGGNPHLRVAQHDHYRDSAQRLDLAARFVAGKLQNTRQLLLRAARDAAGPRQAHLRDVAESSAEAIVGLGSAPTMEVVMGIEGQAARRYVSIWPDLLTSHARVSAPARRVSRPATDPVNAALSLGYGLLRVAVHGALEQVGLDPAIGYLHGIRPAKPSLALDLMEEFRALIVDRMVFTAFNQRQLTETAFRQMPGGAHELTDDGRRAFLRLWSDNRAREWRHRALRTNVPAALLPLVQARILARHLRGDLAGYIPWGPS